MDPATGALIASLATGAVGAYGVYSDKRTADDILGAKVTERIGDAQGRIQALMQERDKANEKIRDLEALLARAKEEVERAKASAAAVQSTAGPALTFKNASADTLNKAIEPTLVKLKALPGLEANELVNVRKALEYPGSYQGSVLRMTLPDFYERRVKRAAELDSAGTFPSYEEFAKLYTDEIDAITREATTRTQDAKTAKKNEAARKAAQALAAKVSNALNKSIQKFKPASDSKELVADRKDTDDFSKEADTATEATLKDIRAKGEALLARISGRKPVDYLDKVPAAAPPRPAPSSAMGVNGEELRVGDRVTCELYGTAETGTISEFEEKLEGDPDKKLVTYVKVKTDTGSWSKPASVCKKVAPPAFSAGPAIPAPDVPAFSAGPAPPAPGVPAFSAGPAIPAPDVPAFSAGPAIPAPDVPAFSAGPAPPLVPTPIEESKLIEDPKITSIRKELNAAKGKPDDEIKAAIAKARNDLQEVPGVASKVELIDQITKLQKTLRGKGRRKPRKKTLRKRRGGK